VANEEHQHVIEFQKMIKVLIGDEDEMLRSGCHEKNEITEASKK